MMTTTLTGCDAESKTFGIGTLCEPATDDTACGTCTRALHECQSPTPPRRTSIGSTPACRTEPCTTQA
jgi:hypothetical protein